MPHIVYVEFPSDGPYGAEAAAAHAELAADIATEPDLVWKVWTEDPAAHAAGGVYLFSDAEAAARYVEKHTRRLESFGIHGVFVRSFPVNAALSEMTRAVLTP